MLAAARSLSGNDEILLALLDGSKPRRRTGASPPRWPSAAGRGHRDVWTIPSSAGPGRTGRHRRRRRQSRPCDHRRGGTAGLPCRRAGRHRLLRLGAGPEWPFTVTVTNLGGGKHLPDPAQLSAHSTSASFTLRPSATDFSAASDSASAAAHPRPTGPPCPCRAPPDEIGNLGGISLGVAGHEEIMQRRPGITSPRGDLDRDRALVLAEARPLEPCTSIRWSYP